MVKVKLLRPLDGVEAGKTVDYPEADAQRLAEYGAVEITGKAAAASPQTKMEAAPANKSAPKPITTATTERVTATVRTGKAKK
jgi:hypothetical protein